MKLEQKLTAPQLAAFTMAGSLLLYASFWLALRLPGHKPPGCECHSFGEFLWSLRFFFLTWVAPLLLGAWAMYGGLAAFKRGIDEDRWDQPTRDQLLRQLKPRPWTWLGFLLFAVAFTFVFVMLLQGLRSPIHRSIPLAGMVFFANAPWYALIWLRSYLKPRRDPLTREPIWSHTQPLQSTHWGER